MPLTQSDEQSENSLAQSDFSRVHNSRDSERDNKSTPIVQRSRALISSRLQCDPSSTNSTTSITPTPLQLRNCADGSVDCAALTTSTTTMTNFNSDSDFNYRFQASNSNSEQTAPSPTYLPQCRAKGSVSCKQRDRKTLLIQGLFVPKIEPEPPPTIHELPISKSQSGGHKYGTRYFA